MTFKWVDCPVATAPAGSRSTTLSHNVIHQQIYTIQSLKVGEIQSARANFFWRKCLMLER